MKHDVEALPWMSGSGFVFRVKMGDHDKPWFRFPTWNRPMCT
ncbi:MAG: hypothetical protein U0904_03345 [Candidatus Nanopelagicales bacterium]|nr:hypothetical protein [Candidatus Nanopelagicales bacterium]